VKSLKISCVDPAELIAEKEVVVGLLGGAVGFRADTFLADELSLKFDDIADTDEKLVAELSKEEFDIEVDREVDCEILVPDTDIFLIDVADTDEKLAVELSKEEFNIEVDCETPVPDTDTFLADELSLELDDLADTDENLAVELSKVEFNIEVDCKMPVPDTDIFLDDELSLELDDLADTDENLAAELSKEEFDIEVECEMPEPDTILESIDDVSEMFELVIVVGIGSWLEPLGDDTNLELIEALRETPRVDELCRSVLCLDMEGSPELFLTVGMVGNEDGANGKLTLVPVACLLTPLCGILSSVLSFFKLDTLDLSLSSHVVDLVTITVFVAVAPRLMLWPIGVTLPSSSNLSPTVRRCAPRAK
jgi:hypothetical protein